MNLIWLLRMKRWVQNPPSKRRIYLVGGVVAFCLGIAIIERVFGWPEWLSLEQMRRGPWLMR